MEELLSRRAKSDSVTWIRAIKRPHGELSGRGYESNVVVGLRDAGVGCGGSSMWIVGVWLSCFRHVRTRSTILHLKLTIDVHCIIPTIIHCLKRPEITANPMLAYLRSHLTSWSCSPGRGDGFVTSVILVDDVNREDKSDGGILTHLKPQHA
jgi:hypothetical protein